MKTKTKIGDTKEIIIIITIMVIRIEIKAIEKVRMKKVL